MPRTKVTNPPTPAEQLAASQIRDGVELLLDKICNEQTGLETDFVNLGNYLNEIRSCQHWQAWGFKNFSAYLASIESKVKRGRTQLYSCLGVAKYLLPEISAETLAKIGITKAGVLRSLAKSGKTLTPEIVSLAVNGSKEELEAAIGSAEQPLEDGQWFSFGGAYLTDEQREEFLRSANMVIRVAGLPVDHGITKWSDVPSPVKREVFQWLCADFLSAYAQEMTGESS